MLRQICRCLRLSAFINDAVTGKKLIQGSLYHLAESQVAGTMESNSSLDQAEYNGCGQDLGANYNPILLYWNMVYPQVLFIHYNEVSWPLPDPECILPWHAQFIRHVTHKDRNFSTFQLHPGNSSICFKHTDGRIDVGFIMSIWKQVLLGKLYTFVIVNPHVILSEEDKQKTPFARWRSFECAVIYTSPSTPQEPIAIKVKDIISHVAYYRRPAMTFGIAEPITVLVNLLHCKR
jgi:hypothetical protein